jgi:hypothetical protein
MPLEFYNRSSLRFLPVASVHFTSTLSLIPGYEGRIEKQHNWISVHQACTLSKRWDSKVSSNSQSDEDTAFIVSRSAFASKSNCAIRPDTITLLASETAGLWKPQSLRNKHAKSLRTNLVHCLMWRVETTNCQGYLPGQLVLCSVEQKASSISHSTGVRNFFK